MISAIVLTKNEEKNIKECLESLKWCDEMIVIDDYSEDKTVKIAKKMGAKVFQRKLADDFAAQRNHALSLSKGEWILFLDADERISEELAKEIVSCIMYHVSCINGFYIRRKDFFLGHKLKHGETSRVKLLRLARRNCGKWERKVHEAWRVRGEIGSLKNPILHYHQNLNEFLRSINYFSTLDARVFYNQGQRVTFGEWLKPLAKFIQNYFLRFGFLDGTAGFVHAVLMSLHSFLVRAKLFMLWKTL